MLVTGRYDRTFIDGGSAADVPPHPYALAQRVNHPPAGVAPNVLGLAFDYCGRDHATMAFPEHLCSLVPNEFARAPSLLVEKSRRPDVLVPGLVLVATRKVEDEELWLNYRLNPMLPRPAWYASVDPEEDARRWGQADL